MKFGMAMVAKRPIIAVTVISSIKVKPFVFVFFNIIGFLGQCSWLLPKLLNDIDTKGARTIGHRTIMH
jgi:hypothetical protein